MTFAVLARTSQEGQFEPDAIKAPRKYFQKKLPLALDPPE